MKSNSAIYHISAGNSQIISTVPPIKKHTLNKTIKNKNNNVIILSPRSFELKPINQLELDK